MATPPPIASRPYVVKGGELVLGDPATQASVACMLSNAVISATADPKEFTAVCGDKVTIPGVTSYVLNLEGAQDWYTDGVSTYLFENDGDLVPFTYTPTDSATPSAAGEVYCVPGDFGGQAGEIATFSVSLGLKGKPTITPGTPPVAFVEDAARRAGAMAHAGDVAPVEA